MPTADCFFGAPTTAIGGWSNIGSNDSAFCMSLQDGTNRIEVQNETIGVTFSGYFSSLDYSAIPAGSLINSITLKHYEGRSGTGAGTARHEVERSGSTTNGTQHTWGANWTLYTEGVARPGGGSWVYADLANVRVRYRSSNDGTSSPRYIRVDQLWLTIDYTPTGLYVITY